MLRVKQQRRKRSWCCQLLACHLINEGDGTSACHVLPNTPVARISRFPGLTAPGQPVARPHRSRKAGFPASPIQIDRSPGLTVPVRPVIQTPRPVHPVAQARHPVRPVTRTPQRHTPPAGARHPLQIPVSRPLHRPGETPGMVPAPCYLGYRSRVVSVSRTGVSPTMPTLSNVFCYPDDL